MTLKKIDYSKLVVYKIVCKDLSITDLYVGSTTNFDQRKKQHKNRCYNQNSTKYHYLLYQTIRKYGGFENWDMIIVERCPCDNSYDARKLERFYFEQLKANLNMLKPFTTDEEKKQERKERKQTDQYKEKAKETWKNYYAVHKENLIEKKKEYYIDNKDKIQERKTEKITCTCGAIIARSSKSAHEKSFIHISRTKPLFHLTDESNA